MAKRVEGTHTGFLRPIIGMLGRRLGGGTRETRGVEGVREADGTQSERTFIE